MQTMAITPVISAAVLGDSALKAQIAALRESLKNHRNRARQMWDACAAETAEPEAEARLALGRFTEKLLKGKLDEAFS